MVQHGFLLRELVKRDLQGRYAGSLLGFVWSFVQPLFLLALYYFVFSTVMRVPLEGECIGSFGFFLFAGLLPWMAVQEGVMRGATAVTDNAMLVKKVTFPAEILVLAVVLAALLHGLIAGGVFLVLLAATGSLAVSGLPLLLLALPLQVALTLGLGFLLASVNVFFRDTSQILGMVLTAWFFLTPIVYPLSRVPEGPLRLLVDLNPMATVVALYRQAFFCGGGWPPPQTAWLALVAIVVLFVGLALFRRLQPAFVDEI